ncbi:phosphatase [Aureococcus anophagefferens]|nr:phosphatase [Aureococcus anophagefferens]
MRFTSQDRTVMHYEARRVLVSIDNGEQALSIVDQPRGMMKRVFHRKPNRCIELDRVTRLALRGGTMLDIATGCEVLSLECACAEDARRWLALLRAHCGQASCPDDDAPKFGAAPLAPSPSGSEASSILSDDPSPSGRRRPRVGPIGANLEALPPASDGLPDSSRPPSASSAEELGCVKLNRLLYIGGRPVASDKAALEQRKITHVVNMAVECDDYYPESFAYYRGDCTDKAGDSMARHFEKLVAFIDGAKRSGAGGLPSSRSTTPPPEAPSDMTLLAALAWLKDRRPIASPHPTYMFELVAWEATWHAGPPSLNAETYRNNRYECVDRLRGELTDPRSSLAILGSACKDASNQDLAGMNAQFRALNRSGSH